MPSVSICPDLSRYQQLATGKLAAADEDALLAHLESCEGCARKLKALGDSDELVSLIRQARVSKDVEITGPIVARLVERLSKLRPGDTSAVQQDETVAPRAPVQAPRLTLACPACGKGSTVGQELAGKKVMCPHCQQAFRVPGTIAVNASKEKATIGYNPAGGNEIYDFLSPPQAPDELGRLGPYRILKVLGAGGMGVVFRAEDPQLVRPVALKAMLPAVAGGEAARQRFLREARAAAALKHDHIVTIYQVGEDRGIPFLAMEILEGEPLDLRLERAGKLPVAEVVRISREIALGLAAAHKRDLIHRDIKPANIWLEAETGRVKILDFGLARAAGAGAQLTQQGAIVGTPAYMAPEQAQGKALDGRCDLFSLGCVLYRLATGKPAFQGTDVVSTLMAVATEEPPPPRQLDAAVPPALSDLIMGLLAKEPGNRPASAQAVAEALLEIDRERRQPPASAQSPIGQPAPRQRRPLLIGAAGLLLCLVLTSLWAAGMLRVRVSDGTIVLENVPVNAEVLVDGNQVTVKLADGGKRIEIQAPPGKRILEIRAAGFKIESREVTFATGERQPLGIRLEPLASATAKTAPSAAKPDKAPTKPDTPSAVAAALPAPSKELEALRRDQIPRAALALAGGGDPENAPASLVGVLGDPQPIHTASVRRVAFSPDGRWLASGSEDNTLMLRDVATGRVQRILKGHTGWVPVAFSKDSRILISAGHDGTLKLWPLDKEVEPPQTLHPNLGAIRGLAASADGRFVAATGLNGRLSVWKWGQWDTPVEITPEGRKDWMTPDPGACLALSPDGELLAVGRREDKPDIPIRIYRTRDGKKVVDLSSDPKIGTPREISFSRDGKYLACALEREPVGIWEVASWKRVADVTFSTWNNMGRSIAFGLDDKTLATSSIGWINIHDLPLAITGVPSAPAGPTSLPRGNGWTGPAAGVLSASFPVCLAYSADGKLLASGSLSGAVQVWDTTTWEEQYQERGHLQPVLALAMSPNGKTILSASTDDTLRQWDLSRSGTNQIIHHFAAFGSNVSLAYSPSGKMFALVVRGEPYGRHYDDTTMRVWDATTLKNRWTVRLALDSVAFSPDGKTLAGSVDQKDQESVRLWDVDSGTEVHRFRNTGRCPGVAFSGDGKLLAAVSSDKNFVKVWNVESGTEVHSWQDTPMTAVSFQRDGQILATGHKDGTISIWNLAAGKKKRTLSGHGALVQSLKFTPDGKTLVSSGHDGMIRLWNPDFERAREVIPVGPPKQRLTMDLDASGKYLFAVGNYPVIFVLRLP